MSGKFSNEASHFNNIQVLCLLRFVLQVLLANHHNYHFSGIFMSKCHWSHRATLWFTVDINYMIIKSEYNEAKMISSTSYTGDGKVLASTVIISAPLRSPNGLHCCVVWSSNRCFCFCSISSSPFPRYAFKTVWVLDVRFFLPPSFRTIWI